MYLWAIKYIVFYCRGTGRRETLMEQLVWMIGGARPGTGAVVAGAPFVLVGAPGDYVFGGEGTFYTRVATDN